MRLEEARIKTLSILRAAGGPFVTSAEVLEYTADGTANQLEKQKRLANEVKYHRETSRSLPHSHPLFRMMAVCSQKKKRSKMSVHELEGNLVKYLNLASRGSTAIMLEIVMRVAYFGGHHCGYRSISERRTGCVH